MSFDDTINAYFVTTTNTGAGEEFSRALQFLRNHIPLENIREIKANEGFPLIASGRLTKKDVFVFDRFEGDFFGQLQAQTKSLIVGPKCLISCLLKCEPIPLGSSPVYTTAMRNLQVSATGISTQKKERLRVLIQYMGGHYFQNFGRTVTHLISNTIKSTKYEQATLNGIPVMHVDWVDRVWERSCADDVTATDPEFDNYRLPIFFGANITCTGLDATKKGEIMRMVNENGGTYHTAFRSQQVDIVITEKDKTKSDKYKAAVAYKKDILVPEWIFDSVERGFALPTKGYQVKPLKVSTPTRTDQSIADFTQIADLSRISTAGGSVGGSGGHPAGALRYLNTMNETVLSDTGSGTFKAPEAPTATKNLQRCAITKAAEMNANSYYYRLVYEEICAKTAKKAGNFLDGCCIYLSGFRTEEREKLNRILNVGGATRYDVVNEKITHIIVGKLNDAEYRSWKRDGLLTGVNVVRLNWLLESIKLKQPASEVVYRMSLPDSREPDAPSPSSKKTLRSMNHSFKQPAGGGDMPSRKKLFDVSKETGESETSPSKPLAASTEIPIEDEVNLISQYSQENVPVAAMPPPPPQPLSIPQQQQGATTSTPSQAEDVTLMNPIASSTILPGSAKGSEKNPPATAPAIDMTARSDMVTIDYENLNVFQGISLFIDKDHFDEQLYSQLLQECEAAQGNLVEASYRDVVDYAIVCFEFAVDESQIPVKYRQIVTELYVEQCLKANKLVPVEYYHRHIPISAESKPLAGMTIVISTYTALERDFIEAMASVLGANVNNNFVKKERALLVCPVPEGSKYQAALKWRYPVVQSSWLVRCCSDGHKHDFTEYLVGDCPQSFPVSPTLKERNSDGREHRSKPKTPENNLTVPSAMDVDAVENNHEPEMPSTSYTSTLKSNYAKHDDFTPLRNKRVSELAGPGTRSSRHSLGSDGDQQQSSPDSPHTPVHNTSQQGRFEFLEKIVAELEGDAERECLREVIEEMRNNRTPELERIRRQACTPINRRVPTPKGIPDFCTTPEFEKRMADEFERRWRLPVKHVKPDTPIDVLRRRVMRATCIALGIPYNDGDDDQQQQQQLNHDDPSSSNSIKKSYRKAASSITTATHATPVMVATTPLHRKSARMSNAFEPRSILANLNASNSSNASDTFVPATQQTPNTSRRSGGGESHTLNATPLGVGERASLGKSTINFDKITFEETTLNTNATRPADIDGGNRSATITSASPEVRQITEYLKNCESRRQSLKRNGGRQSALPIAGASTAAGGSSHEDDEDKEKRHRGDDNEDVEMMETQAHYVQPFESEQFVIGTEEVGWRDPDEFSLERRQKAKRTMQHEGTPRFSISCSDDQMRQNIIEKILKLGGEVSENLVNFDPECTHYICEHPNRGEKIIGCISSGKWVLGLNYIEECYSKDVFIDEELYEWGNCKALNLPAIKQDQQVIAHAAHMWRKALSANRKDQNFAERGAFSGFRAILQIPERSYDSIKNIIKAGSGEVIDVKSPYGEHNDAHMATHCFMDVKKMPITKADYQFLLKHNVRILSHMYINAYLMSGDEEDYSKYQVKM